MERKTPTGKDGDKNIRRPDQSDFTHLHDRTKHDHDYNDELDSEHDDEHLDREPDDNRDEEEDADLQQTPPEDVGQ